MRGQGRRTPARAGQGGLWLLAATVWLWGSCDFDAAFQQYCKDNPRCPRDAATEPLGGPDVGPDVGPEAQVGSEAERDVGPDVGPDGAPDMGFDFPGPRDPWRDGGPGGRSPLLPRSCMSSGDCAPFEECNPIGHVCMIICDSSDECLGGNNSCVEVFDQNGIPRTVNKVCSCDNSQSCSNYVPGLLCNAIDSLCEPPCSASPGGRPNPADCPGFQPPRICHPNWSVCVECIRSIDCSNQGDGRTQCNSGVCVSPS
jgi:hypothetical protein